MTSTQTGDMLNNGKGENGYGFGWSTTRKARRATRQPGSGGTFGHGGAYATDMEIDPGHGLVTVFMVQHAGFPAGGGGKVSAAFRKAAVEAFGK